MPAPASSASDHPQRPAAPKRQLTLFDSTCIIVGIIIGVGIYESSPLVASNVPEAGWLFRVTLPEIGELFGVWLSETGWLVYVWLLGGLISLFGAFCYAELATAYPKAGGDYVYLTRAFDRTPGFLFAWSQLWVIRPGSIGAYAYVFGRYADRLWPLAGRSDGYFGLMVYAAASVVVLTAINILGVREGKWTQNLLTVAKVIGLAAIVVAGLFFASADPLPPGAAKPSRAPDFGLAMIFVLYTYGGWNEMAYVGAEVRNPNKNILRALLLGTVAVTLIYVLANFAFVHALGFPGTCQPVDTVAEDVLTKTTLGDWGPRAISVLICISALGAINGMIFTGARIYYAMGTDHRLYARLGRWNRRLGTPVWSLVVQGVITVVLIVIFGLVTKGGFQSMVEFTTPIFWLFCLLVGFSVFVLRWREPELPRPYRVPLYPLTPILFCGSSVFMLYSSLSYSLNAGRYEPVWAVALMLIGLVLSFYNPRPRESESQTNQAD